MPFAMSVEFSGSSGDDISLPSPSQTNVCV
jgi:hypothetical protein